MATECIEKVDGATVEELTRFARDIAEALTEAETLIEKASETMADLVARIDDKAKREAFARFDYEVIIAIRGLAEDLDVGVPDGVYADPFNIDRTPKDARDLLDLIALASTEREAVKA